MENSALGSLAKGFIVALCYVSSSTALASMSLDKAYIGLDSHIYPKSGQNEQGYGDNSIVSQLEFFWDINQNITGKIVPYMRIDPEYSERNDFQMKELDIEYWGGNYSVNVGQRILAWSTVETVNVLPIVVADIVNERDIQGDPDGQEKLGRAMLSFSWLSDSLKIEAHVLPYFSERLFPGVEAREHVASGVFDIANDPLYTEDDEENDLNFASRLEWVRGEVNLAAIYYHGYHPQPFFLPDLDELMLTPVYYSVDSVGLTLQAAMGSWLHKIEAIKHNINENDLMESVGVEETDFSSLIFGSEYTLIRPKKTADLSFFAEYVYDSRDEGLLASPFNNNIFTGFRWASNDHAGSTLTGGIVAHLEHQANVFHLNYKRRLGEKIRVELTTRLYDVDEESMLYIFKDDHLINFSFQYYL